MTSSWAFAIAFLLAFLIGVRSTIRIARTYLDIRNKLVRAERAIALTFVIVAAVVTGAAGWFGGLAVMRISGLDTVFWTPLVSFLVVICVLALPPLIDLVLDNVARTVSTRPTLDDEQC